MFFFIHISRILPFPREQSPVIRTGGRGAKRYPVTSYYVEGFRTAKPLEYAVDFACISDGEVNLCGYFR